MLIRDKLLSHRLQAIYDLVEHGDVISDIGTDHAHLIVALVKDKKIPLAYGVDNKSGPLSQAQSNVRDYELENEIVLTLTQDDHPYHHVDGWIIAGLGFETIKTILMAHYETIKKLKYIIIQSNTKLEALRSTLMAMRCHIIKETLVEDDHYYTIIKASYIDEPYTLSAAELLLGPDILKHKVPPFNKYCEHIIKKANTVLNHAPPTSSQFIQSNATKQLIENIMKAGDEQ